MIYKHFGNLNFIWMIALLLLLWGSSTCAEVQVSKKPGRADRLIAKVATEVIQRQHYSRRPLDNDISARLFEAYFDALDPDRYFFYMEDIDHFAHHKSLLDDFLGYGHVEFAYDVYNIFLERFANRLDYVKSRLNSPFDFSIEEAFIPDRSDQPWCKNPAEMDEVWRLRIKNDLLNRMISDENKKKKKAQSEDKEIKDPSKNDENSLTTFQAESDLLVDAAKAYVCEAYEKHYQRIQGKDNLEILEIFLSALAQIYDPHSAYMAPMTKENFDISMKHSLEGIGAKLMAHEGYVKVTEIIAGGPADRDGRLKVGDLIVAVAQNDDDPVDIVNLSLQRVVGLIRGPKGTRVSLSVIEAGEDLSFPKKTVKIVRGTVNLVDRGATIQYLTLPISPTGHDDVSTGELSHFNNKEVGVISLPTFYTDFDQRKRGVKNYISSTQDVLKLILEAKQRNIAGLIMDLRSNSGGSLEEAVSLVGLFFPKGPVVQVRYSSGEKNVLYDQDAKTYYDGPLIVLVDRYSASAAEIFAAAIQDYHRGVIIGENSTHGKGTVQTLHSLKRLVGNNALLSSLKPGSLKITTAKFYRVTGGSTQNKGVTPDIVIPSFRDKMEIGESHLPTALLWDQIQPLEIQGSSRITAIIPTLQKRFKRRVEHYDWYNELVQDIERYGETIEQNRLPLNFSKRIEAERERQKWSKKIRGYKLNKRRTTSEDKPDKVLAESLLVLADLITIQRDRPDTSPPSTPKDPMVTPGKL